VNPLNLERKKLPKKKFNNEGKGGKEGQCNSQLAFPVEQTSKGERERALN